MPIKRQGMVVGGRKKAAQDMRKGVSRSNSDGTVSSHKMEWGSTGNKKYPYEVNPTIFPDGKGGFTDLGGRGNDAYNEAKKRGEVLGFKSAKKAEKFSYGTSYKKGVDKKDAKRNYKEDKKAGRLGYKEVRKETKSKRK